MYIWYLVKLGTSILQFRFSENRLVSMMRFQRIMITKFLERKLSNSQIDWAYFLQRNEGEEKTRT